MSIYFDEVESMPVRKNDPSKHTVSVGYNGKDNIVEVIDTGIRIFEISSNDSIKFITKTWAQLNA